ncbi:hypothetical protein COCMIDRAFT_97058, partial [Bipolaris oryzae ATCC 44560]
YSSRLRVDHAQPHVSVRLADPAKHCIALSVPSRHVHAEASDTCQIPLAVGGRSSVAAAAGSWLICLWPVVCAVDSGVAPIRSLMYVFLFRQVGREFMPLVELVSSCSMVGAPLRPSDLLQADIQPTGFDHTHCCPGIPQGSTL